MILEGFERDKWHAQLWRLDHDRSLKIKNVFGPKEIQAACPPA